MRHSISFNYKSINLSVMCKFVTVIYVSEIQSTLDLAHLSNPERKRQNTHHNKGTLT